MLHVTLRSALLFTLSALAACGSSEPPTGGNPLEMAKAASSGDAQCGAAGAALPSTLRVQITQGGSGVAGTTVTWAVAGGGSVNPTTSQTGADGVAATTLTLPSVAGAVTVQASASGVTGSPQTFTASAAGSQAGIQVANNSFNPASSCVTIGGTVTFTWGTGAAGHNVTPVGSIPISPQHPALLNAPQTFPVDFPTAGTFVYFCSAHGTATGGMRGTVTVVP